MEVFVARQPIFDLQKKIFGYELLFRQGLENTFPNIDGDVATSNVLSNTFFSFELIEILGNKPGLVNFTKNLILQKIPLSLPQEHIIVEVLEDVEPDDEIISALKEFKEHGLDIALDDFIYHEKFKPLIELCKIIKFDLIETPLNSLVDIVKNIKAKYDIMLLAEKVETYEEYQKAKEMGFTLFQGYFFCKPEILSKKSITSNQISKLRLIEEVNRNELDLKKIEAFIKKDVSASYKLLKFINSAYFKRANPIGTVKDAMAYLGTEELRKFINVVIISDLSEAKPNELIRNSLIRGRMCERCGSILKTDFSTEELFTLGLFSSMDAILDRDMENILDNISLAEKMSKALLGKDKKFSKILEIVTKFERGDWESNLFDSISGTAFESNLPKFYFDSVKMANSFFN